MQNVFVEKLLIAAGMIFSIFAGVFAICVFIVVLGLGGPDFLSFTAGLGGYAVISYLICFAIWIMSTFLWTKTKTGGEKK